MQKALKTVSIHLIARLPHLAWENWTIRCTTCRSPVKFIRSLAYRCACQYGGDAAKCSDLIIIFCQFVLKRGWSANATYPANKNCTPELPTFGVIAGVNPTEVQWKGLALGEPPSWSRYPLSQVSMSSRRRNNWTQATTTKEWVFPRAVAQQIVPRLVCIYVVDPCKRYQENFETFKKVKIIRFVHALRQIYWVNPHTQLCMETAPSIRRHQAWSTTIRSTTPRDQDSDTGRGFNGNKNLTMTHVVVLTVTQSVLGIDSEIQRSRNTYNGINI